MRRPSSSRGLIQAEEEAQSRRDWRVVRRPSSSSGLIQAEEEAQSRRDCRVVRRPSSSTLGRGVPVWFVSLSLSSLSNSYNLFIGLTVNR